MRRNSKIRLCISSVRDESLPVLNFFNAYKIYTKCTTTWRLVSNSIMSIVKKSGWVQILGLEEKRGVVCMRLQTKFKIVVFDACLNNEFVLNLDFILKFNSQNQHKENHITWPLFHSYLTMEVPTITFSISGFWNRFWITKEFMYREEQIFLLFSCGHI